MPLALSLFVPYPFDEGWLFAWAVAAELGVPGPIVAPIAGVAMVLAVLVPRVPPFARAAVVTLAGAVGLWSLRATLLHPDVVRELDHDVARLSLGALDGLAGAVLVGGALEVAAQRRRASRALAVLAFLGWALVASRFFVALDGEDFDTTPFILSTEAIDDAERDPEMLLLAVPVLTMLLLAILCAVLALRKAFGAEERRVARRFRTAWAAVFFVGAPAVATGALLALASVIQEEIEFAVVGLHAFAILYGVPLGLVWGLGHALAWVPDVGERVRAGLRSGDPAAARRARTVLGAAVVLAVGVLVWQLALLLRPDPREGAIAGLTERTQETVVAALMGQPYDEMLHGGYPESDIRASRGALRDVLGADATVEPVVFAFDVEGAGRELFRGRVVVLGGGRVRWSSLAVGSPSGPVVDLDAADPGLGAAASLAAGAIDDGDCVSVLDPGDLPEPAHAALGTSAEPAVACGSGGRTAEARDRLRDVARGAVRGGIERYVIVVRSGDRWLALHGTWYASTGRLWLGPVRVEPLGS